MQAQYLMPALTMIGLTFVVLLRIMQTRFPNFLSRKVHPQKVASRKEMSLLIEDSRASDNFMNLFELPVLFYFLSLTILILKIESNFLLGLMWGFVFFRAIHSYIHCTYNKVIHRFYAFLMSCLCLIAIFITTVFKIIA